MDYMEMKPKQTNIIFLIVKNKTCILVIFDVFIKSFKLSDLERQDADE